MTNTPLNPSFCSLTRFGRVLVTALCAVMFAGTQLPAAAQATKVVVHESAVAARAYLAQQGAVVIATRGPTVIFQVDDAVADRLRAMPGVQVRGDFDVIALRRPLDTRAAAGAAAGLSAAAPGSRRLKLVQFSSPPTDADLRAVTADGGTIVQYVPQNAFLVWTEGTGGAASLAARAAATRSIQYYGDFLPEYALSPSLDSALNTAGPVAVTVQLFASPTLDADLAEVARLSERILSEPSSVVAGTYVNVRTLVRGTNLRSVTELQSVVNVEPYIEPKMHDERQGQILAGNLNGSAAGPSGPGYLSWLTARGFSTDPDDYPVVAVVDDGVDNGTASPMNDEFYELSDPTLQSRIAFAVLPPGSFASTADGPDGHGNINASIMAGFNAGTGAAVTDGAGFHYGLGISPYGRLANVRIFSPGFDIGLGNATMVADYFQRGARISTNSWGAPMFGLYDTFSQEYDALTRDAQSGTSGNQEILFVFSAGNDGPSPGSIGTPGTAKNVLTVGASETSNPAASAGDGCGMTGTQGDDAREIIFFSSRGPCSDGRIKPEIVAPGTFIQGAATQPTFFGGNVCGAATNDFFTPGDDALFPPGSAYTWSSGTSHSTPAVAGYASLVREFLAREYGITDPSPALVKAYAIHSARYLNNASAETLPGMEQGFGMADMGLGFATTAPRFFDDQATIFGAPGQQVTFTGASIDPTQPIRIALVWTDPPGATFGDAFVNDLNLVVVRNGVTYHGNHFAQGESQPSGTADPRNNTEAVFLPPQANALTRITIDAANIVGDGVPGNGDATDQDFALVAYNFATVSSAGILSLDRDAYSCASVIQVTVGDSDVAGSLPVALTTATGDSESVSLSETPSGSGLFVGTVTTSDDTIDSMDGVLQVTNGDTVTVRYQDANHGNGAPAAVEATATIDCIAPNASNVAATEVTPFGATVGLDTSEPASVVVRYGASCDDLTQMQSSANATSHSVRLSGLAPGQTYFFQIEVTDMAGNTTIDDNAGACYSFSTPIPQDCNHPDNVFANCGFETGDFTGWTAQDHPAPYLPLQVAAQGFNAGFGFFPSQPTEGLFSTVHGFDGGMPGTILLSQDVTLPAGAPALTFDYRAAWDLLTYGATLDREFFVDIEPAGGGIPLQSTLIFTAAAGTAVFDSGPLTGSVDLSFWAGLPVRVTFRWTVSEAFSGPALFEIDNVSARSIADSTGTVALNRISYACGNAVEVAVADLDLVGAASVSVDFTTPAGDMETLSLVEVASGSPVFRGMLATSSAAVVMHDGILQIGDGQVVTVTYADADDGSGSPAVVQDTAVFDCAGPEISNVMTSNVTSSAASVTLETSEAATVVVRYGTNCGDLSATQSSPGGAQVVHAIGLTGLNENTMYFYRVEATDTVGNLGVDDHGGSCYSVTTTDRPDFFTEWFIDADNDLDNHTITFTPVDGGDGYTACTTPAAELPTDPANGTQLALSDDSFVEVPLSGGAQVRLYGVSYGTMFVGSNGYVTFGQGDGNLSGYPETHFSLPRVAALFRDLNPGFAGTVSWKQLSDRVAVTFDDVPQFALDDSNTFQIELFFNGMIRITYLTIDTLDGIAGLSAGHGLSPDFVESDLTGYECSARLCPAAPRPDCKRSIRPHRSLLVIKEKALDAKDSIYWDLRRIEATSMADLGNPLEDTDYALCVYASDSMDLQMQIRAPHGGTCGRRPCWQAQGDNGFRYDGRGANVDGLRRLVVHTGPNGRGWIRVDGRGVSLPMPPMPVPQDDMAKVQLVNSDGMCWDAEFVAPAMQNSDKLFRDRSE